MIYKHSGFWHYQQGTGSGWVSPSPQPSYVVGAWAHLGISYDGTNGTLFVNGEPFGPDPMGYAKNTVNPFTIGNEALTGGFVGIID